MRSVGFTESDVGLQPLWPTLSTFIRVQKGNTASLNQAFLKTLTFGYWADYSSISHATFQGLKMIAPFFLRDRTAHEKRHLLKDKGDLVMSQHLARAAAILLCTLTEIQVFFKFEGARIDNRLRECWAALNVFVEVRELFEKRYQDLLASELGVRLSSQDCDDSA